MLVESAALDEAESPAQCDHWVVVCTEPGAVISVSVSGSGRSRKARAVVFTDSGQTLWFDSDGDGRRQDFDLVVSELPGRTRLTLTVRAGTVSEPAEIGAPDVTRRVGQLPVILKATLVPLARPAVLDGAGPAESSVAIRGYRATGSLALGSVTHDLRGQVWFSRTSLAEASRAGTRIHAVFQDGSSLYAARTPTSASAAKLAAVQVNDRISRTSVPSLRVVGESRQVPESVRCELGDASIRDVRGAPRHSEGYQHLAFLRPSGPHGVWFRVGYTPFDFVRGGTTGFGLLEHAVAVDGVTRPDPEIELPDPWD